MRPDPRVLPADTVPIMLALSVATTDALPIDTDQRPFDDLAAVER